MPLTNEREAGRVGRGLDPGAPAARPSDVGTGDAGDGGEPAVSRAAVADVPASLVEVRRLRIGLRVARMRYANLVAAGRATLFAVREGEADPLYYLRDELPGGWS